ncbi:glycosyltransferase [Sulfurovum sp.]|uniref:glycosyltransferase n=1 Tax=Sulfurovum sp. TaxID=1969726 RepID=UPI002629507F|nr:glycosyltransferase [Sulfurovum sp.]
MFGEVLIKNTPAISVVIPVYNVEVHVAEAIEDILSHTFANIQKVLLPYRTYHKQVSWIQKDEQFFNNVELKRGC